MDSNIEIRNLPGYVWLWRFGSRTSRGESGFALSAKKKTKKKKKKKTSRGKVLDLKILNLNRKAKMKNG